MAIDLSGPGPGPVYPQTVSEGTAIYVVVIYISDGGDIYPALSHKAQIITIYLGGNTQW